MLKHDTQTQSKTAQARRQYAGCFGLLEALGPLVPELNVVEMTPYRCFLKSVTQLRRPRLCLLHSLLNPLQKAASRHSNRL